MNKKEAADVLGISTRSVELYCKQGKLSVSYVRAAKGREAVFDDNEVARLRDALQAPLAGRPAIAGPDHGGALVPAGIDREAAAALAVAIVQQIASQQETAGQQAKTRPAITASDKLLLTLDECRELTGLSRDILRDAIRANTLYARQIGKAFRVKRTDLETYIGNL